MKPMNELISSLQNPKIKNILKLKEKARERKKQNLFVIEGARELSLAIQGNYRLESVFLCKELFQKSDYPEVLQAIQPEILYEVSETVFEKLAYREKSDGIIALAYPKSHLLSDLSLTKNPFIIVLESVEKPGNLGAILRTADASQVDAVIICDPLSDLYNPNVIRSSIGCLFTVPIAVADNQQALEFLKEKKIETFAAELKAAQWYQDTDFTKPSAIIMGNRGRRAD